ncbi:MAG: MerR family DNA-binding protein [Streptomyces sp.]|nr:MerR family DNA-binding protein [Streptomyces sp.]
MTTLQAIKPAQRLGFTLDEVSELLEAGGHRHGRPVPAAGAVAGKHRRPHHHPPRPGRGRRCRV